MGAEPATVLLSVRVPADGDILGLAALVAAGFLLAAGGAFRRFRPARALWPASLFLLVSAGLLASGSRIAAGLVLALLVLLAATAAALSAPAGAKAGSGTPPPRRRLHFLVPVALLAVAAAGLLPGLGDARGSLCTWEPSVLYELEQELIGIPSALAAFGQRLVWQGGFLSSGGDSLLYGFPTFLLLRDHAASLLSLRIASALLALASLWLAWGVSRRILGEGAASGAALLWLLAPPFVLYGRYATSVTAMWATLWLALGAVHALVSRPTALRAAVAALALYLASLQYASGRVLVVALLLLTPAVLLAARGSRLAARATLVLALSAGAAILLNARFGRVESFWSVRGEHLLGLRHHLEAAGQYVDRPLPQGTLSFDDTVAVALGMVRSNLPAFAVHVAPVAPLRPDGEAVEGDPPHVSLLLRSGLPLVLWGLGVTLAAGRRNRFAGAGLAALFILSSVPLLLTNRVDVGRAGCLLPLLVLWGGAGAADLLGRISRAAGRPAAAAAAILFAVGGGAEIASKVRYVPETPSAVGASVVPELRRMEGPVRLGLRAEYRDLGGAWLAALDRLRQRPDLLPTLLSPSLLQRLATGPGEHPPDVEALAALALTTPLLLGPAGDFPRLPPLLKERGLTVSAAGTDAFPLLRVERGPAATKSQFVKSSPRSAG